MNKFSIKKLLFTVFCSVLVTTSLGFTLIIPGMASQYILTEELGPDNENAREALVSIGKSYEEGKAEVEKKYESDKQKYGNDYPAEGVFLYRVQISTYVDFLETYLVSVATGVILGILIYVIWIQNSKGKKLFIQLIVCAIATVVLAVVAKVLYAVAIGTVAKTGMIDMPKTDGIGILAMFGIIFIVVYISNFIYQKHLSNKLNKSLKE